MQGIFVAVVAAVLFVNGFTDAPGAISGVVLTHRLSFSRAAALAAVCNLAGMLCSLHFFPAVAGTVTELAPAGTAATCTALLCVAFWGMAAWLFGIPTSESHALVAALCGVEAAQSGMVGLPFGAIAKVGLGLFLSTLPAALFGALCVLLCAFLLGRWDRRRLRAGIDGGLMAGAALSAFFHGAQDGLKFLALLFCLCPPQSEGMRVGFILLCAGALCLGTALGGGRIIRGMGRCLSRADGVRLFCADGASALILCACSLLGLPVSTTHVKACAAFGASGVLRGHVDKQSILEMLIAWIVTVPACFLLGYVMFGGYRLLGF